MIRRAIEPTLLSQLAKYPKPSAARVVQVTEKAFRYASDMRAIGRLDCVLAGERLNPAEILRHAAALERRKSLCGQTQPVRHRHADSPRAKIESQDSPRHRESLVLILSEYYTRGAWAGVTEGGS